MSAREVLHVSLKEIRLMIIYEATHSTHVDKDIIDKSESSIYTLETYLNDPMKRDNNLIPEALIKELRERDQSIVVDLSEVYIEKDDSIKRNLQFKVFVRSHFQLTNPLPTEVNGVPIKAEYKFIKAIDEFFETEFKKSEPDTEFSSRFQDIITKKWEDIHEYIALVW